MMQHSRQFWSASEAWYRSRLAAQAKADALKVRPSSTLQAVSARWARNADRYLARHRALPRQLVRVDPALQLDMLALANRVAPELTGAYDRHIPSLALAAWRDWPVRSGLSKSLLALEYEAHSEQLIGAVRSRAPYTFFIKGHPHRRLLDQKGAALADRIGRDVVEAVAR